MLFQRLIWCALLMAVMVGSVQFAVQRVQAVPIVLAAEAYEEQKVEPSHAHGVGVESLDHHRADEVAWVPADGLERSVWTWIANALHAFGMALLLFAAMGTWIWVRGATVGMSRLAMGAAAAGWLSLHFWPSLGLPAEIPGMEAAALGARQAWWALAALSAAGACAVLAFSLARWRGVAAVLLLALPFVVGAPQFVGDPLAGFSGATHARLQQLAHDFVWATTWVSLTFWGSLGGLGGWVFARWLKPSLVDMREGSAAHRATATAVQATR